MRRRRHKRGLSTGQFVAVIVCFLAAFFALIGTLTAQAPPPNRFPTKPNLNGTELLQIDADQGIVPTSPLYLSTLQIASLASNATVPWPATGTVVISSGFGNPPGGLQPINGNCLVGNSTPAWTVAPCPGGASVTFPSAGSLVVSTGPSSAPSGIAPVNNSPLVASGGAWLALPSAPNSIYCTSAASVPALCNSSTIQGLLGYITGNQPINLIGDTTGGPATTTITTVTNKVNAVAYPANPPVNTVPVVTASNSVAYDTAAQLAGVSGFGTMLQQNASSVAITGGTISGVTISGLSLSSLGSIGANTILCNNTGSPASPIACTVAQIDTLLSLGTMANQAASNVAITGGTLTGTTISGASNTLSNIGLSSLAGIAANSIVCNNTASIASPIACTPSQINTLLGLGTMATQNASSVAITGGSITGLPSPSNASDAATKSYVDASAGGQPPHNPVAATSTTALPNSPTYSNGTSGVGATLTAGANAALVVDGVTVSTTGAGAGTTASRVLVNGQASAFQNGIYTLTTAGSGTVAWVLTRATDFNTAASGNIATGATVLVTGGTVNANTSWSLNTTGAITVGTTALNFVQVGASNSYTADNSTLQLVGSQFSEKNNGTTNAQLSQMAANTVKANFTAALANAADFAMPGCNDTGGNHLNFVMGTGITCGTSTIAGNVTTSDSSSTAGNVVTEAGTTGKTITQGPPIGTTGNSTVLETNSSGQMVAPVNTTTVTASGQITSTVASGTAPFVVASNTNVANLNASSLNSNTFANPGPIGSTTPSSGAFTTLSATGNTTTNISGSTQCVQANSAGVLSGSGGPCAASAVSVTSTTPNIVITPSPGTATFTVGSTGPLNNQSSAGYTIVAGDNTKTVLMGAFSYTLPQAGSTGFASGWQACFLMTATSGQATVNTTTSLFTGASGSTTLLLNPGDWACPNSDGSNYPTMVGHYTTGGVVSTGTITATCAAVSGAVNSPTTPGLIRLTVNQNIPTGTLAVVSGVGGVPEANGLFTVTNISSTLIDLQGSSFGTGDIYTSGGVVSTQALAAQLTATWTRVTAGAGCGVKLPAAVAGASAEKTKNATGSDGLVVWPASGVAINALAANAPKIINNDATGEFFATSTTQWDTQP